MGLKSYLFPLERIMKYDISNVNNFSEKWSVSDVFVILYIIE